MKFNMLHLADKCSYLNSFCMIRQSFVIDIYFYLFVSGAKGSFHFTMTYAFWPRFKYNSDTRELLMF